MRIVAVALLMIAVAVVPTPVQAHHDPTDAYVTIPLGVTSLYIDDDIPPNIYRESNDVGGLQRDFDNNGDGHPGHGNHDTRIF